jgi:hypothetical protein
MVWYSKSIKKQMKPCVLNGLVLKINKKQVELEKKKVILDEREQKLLAKEQKVKDLYN